ncbi:MAG TPA: ACT domain-containing protein [Armatimonadetes bacterium]|jgi:aspartokinase|nr:ACT domain-containing protein [Armatimonadota bacterium]HHX40700.1 ACT domain-containing protein [Armatimonadota bacterium]HPT99260.1 ACT domain-containing protein [Armatimonadota bacterium]
MAEGMRPIRARRVGFEKERGVLSLEADTGRSFVFVELSGPDAGVSEALRVLSPLAESRLPLQFLRIYPDCLSFVVAQGDLPQVREVLAGAGVTFEASEGCAVITVVAPNMRSIPGLMARMGEVLFRRAVGMYQMADSHSSVSCVIAAGQLAEAVEALRREFGLPEEAA